MNERIDKLHYILDIAVISIMVICILTGSKKGAVRMVISMAGCIAAAAAAVFVSGALDEYVYDKFIKQTVISAMEKKADELSEKFFSEDVLKNFLSEKGIDTENVSSPQISEKLKEYAGDLTNEEIRDKLNSMFIEYCRKLTDVFSGVLPDDVINGAGNYINELETENERKIDMMIFDGHSAAELIEREIVRPVLIKAVRTALFFLTFTAVSIIFKIISYAVKALRKVPTVRSADNILGGVLGTFQGLVITAAVCMALYIFINMTSDSSTYINSEIISETKAFKWFFSGTFFLLSLILK